MAPYAIAGGIVVLLRLPQKGNVKSRIAATAGPEEALRIYRELLAITLRTLSAVPFPVYLMYEGGLPSPSDRILHFQYALQPEGDLGSKIKAALQWGLSHHPMALVIGSDCPDLSVEIIEESFEKLRLHDIVAGPATDGGYYLLGCKKIYPMLFETITWGSGNVLAETLQYCQQDQLTYALLPELTDIDFLSDWEKYSQAHELL